MVVVAGGGGGRGEERAAQGREGKQALNTEKQIEPSRSISNFRAKCRWF